MTQYSRQTKRSYLYEYRFPSLFCFTIFPSPFVIPSHVFYPMRVPNIIQRLLSSILITYRTKSGCYILPLLRILGTQVILILQSTCY